MRGAITKAVVVGPLVAVLSAGCGSTRPASHAGSYTASVLTSSAATNSSARTLPSTPLTSPSSAPRVGGLLGFRVADLTFAGTTGWALGTADCLRGPGRCSAMERTTDDGQSWQAISPPPANVDTPDGTTCHDPCVRGLRFATSEIGYAFGNGQISTPSGSQAFFMTTDGGRTWAREPGGADALETAAGNVIRVVDQGNCPPGCSYRVETSNIGSHSWQTVRLPGLPGPGDSVRLARVGDSAYLESYGNPAGGVSAEAVLWASTDGGASWADRGEPCPQQHGGDFGGEVDSANIAAGLDGSVTVLCQPRGGAGTNAYSATSTDGGVTFRPGALDALGGAEGWTLGAVSSTTLLVSSDDTYRSTDGGLHFARLGANSGSDPGPVSWIGFESATAGRALSSDRGTVWTTRDAGLTWTRYTFG